MSSFWRKHHHWQHKKLSKWQLLVQSVLNILWQWHHSFVECNTCDKYLFPVLLSFSFRFLWSIYSIFPWHWYQGPVSIQRPSYLRMVISMLKIRRPLGRLIFNMGIAIPGKTVFLIETAPWFLWWRHPMETYFRVKDPLCGEFAGLRWHQWRGVFMFSLICACINKSKQSWGWWFKTQSRSLCHCNVTRLLPL